MLEDTKNGAALLADADEETGEGLTLTSTREFAFQMLHLVFFGTNAYKYEEYFIPNVSFFADQDGQTVELPFAERKSLIIAMSLHEKGKSALNEGNHQLALVLLLEADEAFNNVRSEILNAADNFGEVL